MRISGILFVLAIVSITVGTLAAQDASPSSAQPVASLTISQARETLKVGSPIVIVVVLTNKSKHDVGVVRDIRGRDLHVDVRDANGKLPADTKLGYILNGHVANPDVRRVSPKDLSGNTVFTTLKPGETAISQFDAAKLYEMDQPGKYTIQVQKPDPENPSLTVKSNQIVITLNR